MTARGWFVLGFAASALAGFGCSGGGGGGGTAAPTLSCTDGSAAAPANEVTMACAGPADSTTEQADVVLTGPSSGTTTLRGLSFDVVFDPSHLQYVPAASDSSPLFSPNALIAIVPLQGQPGHLVVSIQEFGGVVDPVSVGPGSHVVLSLLFRVAAGTGTMSATPVTFTNAQATAASTAITFGSALALSYQ
jgi:hypothetical protein